MSLLVYMTNEESRGTLSVERLDEFARLQGYRSWRSLAKRVDSVEAESKLKRFVTSGFDLLRKYKNA